MKLILVRHALAEDREIFFKKNLEDHLRPLTPKGRKKMLKVATEFSAFIGKVDHIITSPLVRARETAEILKQVFVEATLIEAAELVPQSPPQSFLKWLRSLNGPFNTIMAVGHEPQLSVFASFLLTGDTTSRIDFKKSGMVCFEFETTEDLVQRHIQLKWMIHPKMVD
ncbi:MAG: SixA phosphatase family protein [Pseudobdellovibrionaceae bacterium]|jgi:phosphohistidine phosphatase